MAKKFDFLSPGVQLNEIDESALPAVTDAEGPVIIGRTLRGPAMVPTKVRSLEDFVSVLGLLSLVAYQQTMTYGEPVTYRRQLTLHTPHSLGWLLIILPSR